LRYRADQLFFAPVTVKQESGETTFIGYVSALESEDTAGQLRRRASTARKSLDLKGAQIDESSLLEGIREFTQVTDDQRAQCWGPDATKVGTRTEPRQFNLMFETKVGPLASDDAKAYLRPETAQGIFQNYRNVVDTT